MQPSFGHFQVGKCIYMQLLWTKYYILLLQNIKKQTMFITNKSKSSQKPTTCWFLMKCSLLRCLSRCGTVCLSKMFNHESYLLTLSLWHHRSSIATWAFRSSTEVPTSCEWSHVNLLHSKHLPGISNHYGTRRSTNTLRWHLSHASELIAKVRWPKEFVSTNVIISLLAWKYTMASGPTLFDLNSFVY